MPSRPYFHGDEQFYLQDGALIADAPPFTNLHGVPCVGIVKVLTTDRRYQLGHALYQPGFFSGSVDGDRRVDRRYGMSTLDELVRACREVYGPRPRYAIDPPGDP